MRPLGIPAFRDKLVQEVMKMVLEAIYENSFSYMSHGFRPDKSCHTALKYLQDNFIGAKWFIEGDIKGFFDNIDHNVMVGILKERIEDDRFIRLVRKFLNAGYLENWVFHRNYSGTPQGGIISPILANIYLDKLDKYMEEYIKKFDNGKKRRRNPEHRKLEGRKRTVIKKLKKETDMGNILMLQNEIKEIEKRRVQIPAADSMDSNYRRLKYVRYADDFLIGVIGSKEDSQKIKADIREYLESKLKLELSDEKTLITHGSQPAKFLGFDVYIRKTNDAKRDKNGVLKRFYGNKVVLKVTTATMRKKLLALDAVKINKVNGKEVWKGIPRGYLSVNDDLEILDKYNSEIRGFYNYYSIANNSNVLNSFYTIMKQSMIKTFGQKYRIKGKKLRKKLRVGKEIGVRFTDGKGNERTRIFYHDGFKRKTDGCQVANFDELPKSKYTFVRTSLIDRLSACVCEYCGATENLEMHHVRKLKDLKKKNSWAKFMIARKRKTIAVCHNCHKLIHNGKL